MNVRTFLKSNKITQTSPYDLPKSKKPNSKKKAKKEMLERI